MRLRRSSTRRAYRYVDMRVGLSSTEGRPVGPAGHRSGLTSGAAKEAMTFVPTIDVMHSRLLFDTTTFGRLFTNQYDQWLFCKSNSPGFHFFPGWHPITIKRTQNPRGRQAPQRSAKPGELMAGRHPRRSGDKKGTYCGAFCLDRGHRILMWLPYI